jgi:hypothetical protein
VIQNYDCQLIGKTFKFASQLSAQVLKLVDKPL